MNKCGINRKLLLAYLYGLLNEKETMEIERHLRNCRDCSGELARLRSVRATMEKSIASEKAPDDLQSILLKAKRIEKERENRRNWIGSIAEKFRTSAAVKMAAAGILAAMVILVSAIWVSSANMNYLYMTRAYGDVKVNDKQLFVAKNYIYRVAISKPVKIGVGQGECEFQINDNKYFEMRSLSQVLIEKGKDIVVNFLEGLLIGKVIYHRDAVGLQIATPNQNAIFRIVGTVFYVKSTNRQVEFGVRDGTVRVESPDSNRSFTVRSSEVVRIGNDSVKFLTNSNTEAVFSRLDQYVIRKDFNDVRPVLIKTEPEGGEIYWKDKPLGKAPLFFLGDRKEMRSLTIVKKGYLTKEIDIGSQKTFDVKIKQDTAPEVVWDLGMPGTKFISPVVTSDGNLLVGDESGWFYKLDPITKKILWKFRAGLRNNSLPILIGNTVYFSSTDEHLYAVRYDTGKMVWKQKVGMLVYSAPQFGEGRIYAGNIEGEMAALRADNGRIIWKKKYSDGFYTSPLVYNGNIYIGAMSGNVYSIRSDNGELNWQYRSGGRIVSSRPFISGRKLFFGSNDRHFYALDAGSGRLVWNADIGGEVFTSPVDWDSSIIISTVKGDIFCLDKNSGRTVWYYKTGGKILMNPYLARGKYLFVPTDSTLYVFNKWGFLFTQYPFERNIADFAVSSDQNVYLCGSTGDIRRIRFSLD